MCTDAMPAAQEPTDPVVLAERIRRFQRTGDVADLWPGVTRDTLRAARREIQRVVANVLAFRSADTAHAVAVQWDDSPRVLSIGAYSAGVGALLGAWIDDGRIVAPTGIAALLSEQLEHNRRFADAIDRGIVPALDALARAGIAPLAIKGFHTAHAYWGSRGVRPVADVDLVVPTDRLAEAERALNAVGFTPRDTTTKVPYKRDWLPPRHSLHRHSIERPDARGAWHIDLHGSLDQAFRMGRTAYLDELRGCTSPMTLCGCRVQVPAQPLTLLLLAAHAARNLSSMRLFRVVELIEVIRQDTAAGQLDWEVVQRALRVSNAAAYTFPLFHLAEQLAPGTVHAGTLEQCRRAAGWAVRHTVRRMVPAGGAYDRTGVVSEFMWARGPGDVARHVRTLLDAGHGGIWKRCSHIARRAFAGLIAFRAPDERMH